MKQRKIWISAGGTGGHLFPALAFAEQIRAHDPYAELLFLGGGLQTSRYFSQGAFPYIEIACGSLLRKDPLSLARSAYRIAQGVAQSRRLMARERPDLIVGFGSFYAFPPLLGAKLAGVPLVLHAADAIPGRVIRLMARYAALTVLQFPEAAAHLRGATAVAQMPLRPQLRRGVVSREEACALLGLYANRRTVLVFGGSQGARALNPIVAKALTTIGAPLQVLHYTGDAAVAERLAADYRAKDMVVCVKAFETRMELAWTAADLVIGRAGASTVAELLEFQVPGILIPYPHAMDNHQQANADLVAHQLGGAIGIREADLTPEVLTKRLEQLLADDGAQLREMKAALQRAQAKRTQIRLCDHVMEIISRRK